MITKFWNKRILGLPVAFLLLFGSIYNKVIGGILTLIYRNGLGKCGTGVQIYRGFSCRNPSKIFLDNDVFIDRGTTFSLESDNTIIIHKGASIGRNCFIDFTGGVVIYERAHLAEGVRILTHDHGYDYTSVPVGKSLEIGKNAFIGMYSTILPNVSRVGDNAVIGIGSIVTKDVPDNAIVAGNPAKLIKYRDS